MTKYEIFFRSEVSVIVVAEDEFKAEEKAWEIDFRDEFQDNAEITEVIEMKEN